MQAAPPARRAAGAPGQTAATAAPGREEDDEERRGRRGASLLRGAGFRARGRLRSPPASLSECGGDGGDAGWRAGGLPDLLTTPGRPEQSGQQTPGWLGSEGPARFAVTGAEPCAQHGWLQASGALPSRVFALLKSLGRGVDFVRRCCGARVHPGGYLAELST